MSRRRYTLIQKLLPELKEMLANGKSHQEIEEFFGLTGDRPVHNLPKRERRKEKKVIAGIMPCAPRQTQNIEFQRLGTDQYGFHSYAAFQPVLM